VSPAGSPTINGFLHTTEWAEVRNITQRKYMAALATRTTPITLYSYSMSECKVA
jgi:hypothetical protein